MFTVQAIVLLRGHIGGQNRVAGTFANNDYLNSLILTLAVTYS
jgi:hypothetical protein